MNSCRLGGVARELTSLLEAEPSPSPMRYPLRVALGFVKMAMEVAPVENVFMEYDPGSMGFAQVQECIGAEKTYRLIESFGGTRVYIPEPNRLNEFHALAQLLGMEAAVQLARAFGGSCLKVPTGHWAILRARNAVIGERYAQGCPAAKLAREYGLAENSVYRIAARQNGTLAVTLAPDQETLDLFAEYLPGQIRPYQRQGAGHE
jgi:hypothetical protein